MRKVLKMFLPILIITLVSIFCVSFSLHTPIVSSNSSTFEQFSLATLNLIRNYETDDLYEMSFDINNDLISRNNTLMVSGSIFGQSTGVSIEKFNKDEYSISNDITNISISNNSYTYKIGTNTHILKEPAVEINNELYFPIEDISTELGYDLKYEKEKIILTRPYITKRIIVKSSSNIDSPSAIAKVDGYKGLHIFQYATEQDTIDACDYFASLNSIEWYQVDNIVSAQSVKETKINGLQDSFSYTSWGADSMGVGDYSQYLLDNVGYSNLKDVIVAVLDTGIDSDHEWFTNRIADNGKNFSSSASATDYEYEDVYGHGTHVSGIICDLTLDNVKILPIKVMSDQGYGYGSQIMLGINYVTELKQNGIDVYAMNLSLGNAGGYIGSEEYNMYSSSLSDAYSAGILPVIAAGNDGIDATGTTPANIECAITVAAVGCSNGLYYHPTWSNYGNYIDVCAPGYLIESACVGGGTVSMSGTSMATPHVAGAIALLLSDSNNNYTLSQIEDILDSSAVDLGDSGWDDYYGEGMVNVEYAYAELIPDVIFSNLNTDCTDPFSLTLSSSIPNAQIFYTTDGTIPSLTNGTQYSTPIEITKTQRIKACAFVLNNSTILKYSKIKQMTYCFYGEDIENAFIVNNNGVLAKYNGILTDVVVPLQVNGITIQSIGANAFSSSSAISVTLPSSVTEIGRNAFSSCGSIQYVYGPNVTLIDMYAFNGCNHFKYLTDEYFPEVRTIGKYAFAGCYDMTSINLTKLTLLDYYAFYMDQHGNTTISSVTLPNVKIIGDMAFFNCQNLRNIDLPSVEIIGSGTFRECDIVNIELPSIKFVGNYAFYVNENLLTVDMPEALVVGSSAFYYFSTQLHTVNIPKVQFVGSAAFRLCKNLTNLNIKDLIEVSEWAFNECSLTSLDAPNLRYIGRQAFSDNKLTDINIPSVVSVAEYAFNGNNTLISVHLSSCIETISNETFNNTLNDCMFYIYGGTVAENLVQNNNYLYTDLSTNNNNFTYISHNNEIYITGYNGNNIEELVIPSYINNLPVTKICTDAFKDYTNIFTLNIAYLKTIESGAFSCCTNLQSITLDRIDAIGDNAFKNCINLSDVQIMNVSSIGDYAFYGCSALTEIKFSNKIKSIGVDALGYNIEDVLIPNFVIYGYDTTVAKTYADSKEIIFRAMFNELAKYYYNTYTNNGVTEIYISFVDSYTTGNIIIPSEYNGKTISRIGPNAFENCCFITGIILPSTITKIGTDAFKKCTTLESINLDYITTLEGGTYGIFDSCLALKYISMPLVTNIPKSTFNSCENLIEVNIPQVKTIGETAFYECHSLKRVISPALEEIGWAAFTYDNNLEYIDTTNLKVLGTMATLSNGETIINGNIFVYCSSLPKTMYLPKIETMGGNIFGASSVKNVVIGRHFSTYYNSPIASSITIYGYRGSIAQSYATQNGNTFIPIDDLGITTNLPNELSVNISDECTLNISAIGFQLQYQWYSTTNTTSSQDRMLIPNANADRLDVDTSSAGTFKYFVKITSWDDETITSNICTVTVLEASVYTILASAGPHGTISPRGYIDIPEADSQLFTFTPETGYHVAGIIIDDYNIVGETFKNAVQDGYMFTDVTEDHTIYVEFAINTYSIIIDNGANGTVYCNEPITNIIWGSSRTFNIIPNEDYILDRVIINEEETDVLNNTFTIDNISQNHTVTIVYKLIIEPETDEPESPVVVEPDITEPLQPENNEEKHTYIDTFDKKLIQMVAIGVVIADIIIFGLIVSISIMRKNRKL